MRRLLKIGVFAALGVGAYLFFTAGEDNYTIKMRVANASGLRNGSTIVNGGVPVGTVHVDANRDDVEVSLNIKPEDGPVGKDARVTVISQNALGQKQAQIEPGDTSNPAPDGYVLPPDQVIVNTDLDQLLSTLDPDTRTRLEVLINGTGNSCVGSTVGF